MLSFKLAIFGGVPVRSKRFYSKPFVDEKEIEAVTNTIKEGLFSRFVGSNIDGTRKHLRDSSDKLLKLDLDYSFFGGPNVRKFEAKWAKAHDVKYAISMNSATSCITAGLLGMGISPGDEVITTPLSFTATATAIVAAQGIPIFADIDKETMCLAPDSIESLISDRTKFIVPVHWCGNSGTILEIIEIANKYNIKVLEDACQSPGTKFKDKYLGNFGLAGVFSFSEPKNITTGEGGMLITDDPLIAEKCRLIRNHGEAVVNIDDSIDYLENIIGYNFRMTEAAAAMGWVQTDKLHIVNDIRNSNYRYFIDEINILNVKGLYPQKINNPDTFYAYTVAFRWDSEETGISRDLIVSVLRSEGIPVANGVGRLLSDNPLFLRKIAYGRQGWPLNEHQVDYKKSNLPVSHKIHDEQYLGFFLFGYPNNHNDMDDIVKAFKKINMNIDKLKRCSHNNKTEDSVFDSGRGK